MPLTAKEIRELFDETSEYWSEQHDRMREDLQFSNPANPQQWPQDVQTARKNSKGGERPCMVFDQTNQYIAQVVNDGRQNKPSINVIPGDGRASAKVAKAIEGMVRHIEYVSRAGIAYDTALDQAARTGVGWIIVRPRVIDAELNTQDIIISRVVDSLSVTLDADSTEPDGSDATFGFIESEMSKRAYKKKWPEADENSWESTSDWYGDDTLRICEFQIIETTKENRIVCESDGQKLSLTEDEYWKLAQQIGYSPNVTSTYKKDIKKVRWLKLNGHEILEETEYPSQHLGIVPVIGDELWIDGQRHLCGMPRKMRHGQQAYNYERTAYIESVALQPKAPYVLPADAVDGYEDEWGAANRGNAAYLPYNHMDELGNQIPAPTRLPPPIIPTAFLQGAQIAINDIQASIGMYKSNLGAPSNAVSGRAKMQDQREGDTATFHYPDNLHRSLEQVGRVIVDMLPRIYDTKREARIMGIDGQSSIIQIDPAGEGPDTINLQSGVYDVRVKSGPSYSTLRQETNEALGAIIQRAPQLMPVLGPTWAKMQDWPDADKISRLLLAMAPPEVQKIAASEEGGKEEIPPQVAARLQAMQQQQHQYGQMIEQLTKALHQAHDQLEAATKQVQNGEEGHEIEQAKVLIDHYKAETERMKALEPAMNPQELAMLAAQMVMQALHSPAQQEPGSEIEQQFLQGESQEVYPPAQMGFQQPPHPQEPPQMEATEYPQEPQPMESAEPNEGMQ